MDYRLIRSKRKTVAIVITPQAQVEVRAPMGFSKEGAKRLLRENEDWVAQHLSRAQERFKARQSFCPNSLRLLGQEYPLEEGEPAFDGARFTLPPGTWQERKQSAIALYRELAKAHLNARTQHFAKKMGRGPRTVKITGALSRWGSCTSSGGICYSYRLLMAPAEAVDYVVVHELAHLWELNHSPGFWAVVERALPSYAVGKARLRELEKLLQAEDWS